MGTLDPSECDLLLSVPDERCKRRWRRAFQSTAALAPIAARTAVEAAFLDEMLTELYEGQR